MGGGARGASAQARNDLGACEKRMVSSVLYRRESSMRNGRRDRENPAWFAANADGPVRKVVEDLCGVGRTAVGRYLKEHKEGAGVLGSAFPRGPVEKDALELALKSEMHAGETLYGAILGRVAAVHREGRVNASSNLMRYLAVDDSGPHLPGCPYEFSGRS